MTRERQHVARRWRSCLHMLTCGALLLLAGCGDQAFEALGPEPHPDPDPDPDPPERIIGDIEGAAGVVEQRVAEFFTANRTANQGIAFLKPRAADALEAASGSAASPSVNIPGDAVGKTFVYEPELDAYVPSEREGAPDDGVRFVLYEIDGDRPTSPQVEVGHIDIVDRTSFLDVEARVTVVIDGVTIYDFPIEGDIKIGIPPGVELTLAGSVTEPGGGLSLSVSGAFDGTEDDFVLELSFPLGLGVHGDYTLVQNEDPGFGVRTRLARSTDSTRFDLEIELSADDQRVVTEGTATLDTPEREAPEPVAVLSGPLEDPTATAAEGASIPQEELDAIGHSLSGLDQMFTTLQALLELAFEVLV